MASAVSTSRFKTLPVKKKTKVSIKSFVEANKLSFKKGRGFYQLTKPEVIQEYKEVIVRRKSDGAFITGDKVRELLDIPKSSKKFTLDLDEISDFDVFVQSTSVNRVLLPGTEFLYEVEDEVNTCDLMSFMHLGNTQYLHVVMHLASVCNGVFNTCHV